MHEYHWTFEYAVRVPLVRQFALQAAMRVRRGIELGGPDYKRQDFLDHLNEERDGK